MGAASSGNVQQSDLIQSSAARVVPPNGAAGRASLPLRSVGQAGPLSPFRGPA